MAIQAQLFSENLGFSLGNSQDLVVENACGFDNLCFVPQQQQQQQQQFQNSSQRHHQQSVTISQSVWSHIERQRLELEQFVNLQKERLRMGMQEERKQQIAVLMRKYEWKSEILVRQKDEEIAKAGNRARELHGLLKGMEMENLTWQRVAKENEAMIASLNCSIQRLRESAPGDAESCCQNMEPPHLCRCCHSRNSCVVILPCRHLSSCKDCEVFLDSCPICTMPKKATILALF